MTILSNRVLSIERSATSGMSAKASVLRAKGIDVISLSQGEPDFKTPEHICEAAKLAIDSGKYFSYPPTGGYPDLRKAIANKYARENNVPYDLENIVVSNGAKQALSNIMLAILNTGDEVIIVAPFWVTYIAQVKLAGGVPIVVKGSATNGFKVAPSQIQPLISPKTKAIVFSSPCNPTGAVYNRTQLEGLARMVSQHPNLLVIADEIYEHINYMTETISFAAIPGMIDRTITINGFSKCYAMIGWRVGYLAAPRWIANEVIKIQGHLSSANCSISQRAALAAITGSLDVVKEMVAEYRKRKDLVLAGLLEIPELCVHEPEGAFYIFPDISNYYGLWYGDRQINTSSEMCTYLLEVAHVALVPGSAFGEDSCVRISYAASKANLIEALKRLKIAFQNLRSYSTKEVLPSVISK